LAKNEKIFDKPFFVEISMVCGFGGNKNLVIFEIAGSIEISTFIGVFCHFVIFFSKTF